MLQRNRNGADFFFFFCGSCLLHSRWQILKFSDWKIKYRKICAIFFVSVFFLFFAFGVFVWFYSFFYRVATNPVAVPDSVFYAFFTFCARAQKKPRNTRNKNRKIKEQSLFLALLISTTRVCFFCALRYERYGKKRVLMYGIVQK